MRTPDPHTVGEWKCEGCGRFFCTFCEGADGEAFDLCDTCWHAEMVRRGTIDGRQPKPLRSAGNG